MSPAHEQRNKGRAHPIPRKAQRFRSHHVLSLSPTKVRSNEEQGTLPAPLHSDHTPPRLKIQLPRQFSLALQQVQQPWPHPPCKSGFSLSFFATHTTTSTCRGVSALITCERRSKACTSPSTVHQLRRLRTCNTISEGEGCGCGYGSAAGLLDVFDFSRQSNGVHKGQRKSDFGT